jgi:AcrR family transcriptional regulator
LIDTTLNVLDARGVGDTLLEDVVDQAGVTKGALYHHFESFVALMDVALGERFDAAVDAELGELTDGAEHATDAGDFFAVLAKLVVQQPTGWGSKPVGWVHVLALGSGRVSLQDHLVGGLRRLLDGYALVITTAHERGWVCRTVDSAHAAMVIVSLRLASLWEPMTQERLDDGAVGGLLERYLRA